MKHRKPAIPSIRRHSISREVGQPPSGVPTKHPLPSPILPPSLSSADNDPLTLLKGKDPSARRASGAAAGEFRVDPFPGSRSVPRRQSHPRPRSPCRTRGAFVYTQARRRHQRSWTACLGVIPHRCGASILQRRNLAPATRTNRPAACLLARPRLLLSRFRDPRIKASAHLPARD